MSEIQSKGGKNPPALNVASLNKAGGFDRHFGSWLSNEDAFSDTIISSRVRLARNLQGHRFPNTASRTELHDILDIVRQACQACPSLTTAHMVELEGLSEWECKFYVERRLASPHLIEHKTSSMLVISMDEALSIMVNEEDHLRLQCLVAGLGIETAWSQISDVDDELETSLDFSYCKEYGYLTACPTNLGTGMRVSVFMHMPALGLSNETDAVLKSLQADDIAVRGFYGEGTESVGDIYQISNQLTLGRTEDSVLERIHETARQLSAAERDARQQLLRKDRVKLEDAVHRALGTLRHAKLMSSMEAMNLLSMLRLGVELGILGGVNRITIDRLMVLVQPAHLQRIYGDVLSEKQRDIFRATFVKKHLGETSENGMRNT